MTNAILQSIETFGEEVASDVVAWATNTETLIVDDAKVAWTALKPIFTGISGAQWVILQGLVATANKDVASNDYGDLVTDVANQASAQELAWVAELGSELLTVIVAALHYTPSASA